MVAIRAGAREVPVLKPADVRFGSKADVCNASEIARFKERPFVRVRAMSALGQ